jgi:CRP-like cAMP-binding protein
VLAVHRGAGEERAALARALTAAPAAGALLGTLAEDDDDSVRDAALRSLSGMARAGIAPDAALASRLVERERDVFHALLEARRPADARPPLHAAELARATRRALRRLLAAVALETAAAGRDPAPLAAAERRLHSRSEPMRRRALDVLQEIARTRPRILDAVERWLRPPAADAAPSEAADAAVTAVDPWLGALLSGSLAATEPRLAALRACAFFEDLAGRHAAALATEAAETTLAASAALFAAGDTGDAAYAILSGDLTVETNTDTPPRLSPGAVVGEMSLVDAGLRAFTVRAATAATLLRIDRAAFQAALDRWPDLGMGLLRTLAARLR